MERKHSPYNWAQSHHHSTNNNYKNPHAALHSVGIPPSSPSSPSSPGSQQSHTNKQRTPPSRIQYLSRSTYNTNYFTNRMWNPHPMGVGFRDMLAAQAFPPRQPPQIPQLWIPARRDVPVGMPVLDTHKQVLIEGYSYVKSLAEGGMSAAINLVQSKRSGTLYIEKHIRTTGAAYKKRALAELKALKRAHNQHDNLNQLRTYEWREELGVCSILVEHCDKGSAEDLVQSHLHHRSTISEGLLWHLFASVASALAFMHHGIVDVETGIENPDWDFFCHLDLKPCNIFLTSNGQVGQYPRVVLGDFGCSVSRSEVLAGRENPYEQACGTPEWYPPEGFAGIHNGGNTSYGKKTDIWQLGATIHVMCRLANRPNHGHLQFPDTVLGHASSLYSVPLADTVYSCVNFRKERRLNAKALARRLDTFHVR